MSKTHTKRKHKGKRHWILSWGPSLVIWKHNSLEKKLLAVIIGQVFFFVLFSMAMEPKWKLKMNLFEPDFVLWACWATQKPKWGLPGASSFQCSVSQAQDCLKCQQPHLGVLSTSCSQSSHKSPWEFRLSLGSQDATLREDSSNQNDLIWFPSA